MNEGRERVCGRRKGSVMCVNWNEGRKEMLLMCVCEREREREGREDIRGK